MESLIHSHLRPRLLQHRQKKAPFKGLWLHCITIIADAHNIWQLIRRGTSTQPIYCIPIHMFLSNIFFRHPALTRRAGLTREGAIAKIATALQPTRPSSESHTSTPLFSRPIRSKTAFASTLVPSISSGHFDPSPRTGELIHFVAAALSFSKRERASSNRLTNATRRSLSTESNRPAFALRAIVVGDMQIALETTLRCTCRRLAIRSKYSKGSPSRTRS